MKLLFIILLCVILGTGCSGRDAFAPSIPESGNSGVASESAEPTVEIIDTDSSPDPSAPSSPESAQQDAVEVLAIHPYLNELVEQTAAKFATSAMSEYERAKAAFDYMIEHTYLDEPIGLELWRVHGGGTEAIPFVEQRAVSPLRFGVGMCEDYAAALTLLLQGLGLEAQYVPGLTYSLEGNLVDHAWTMVKIDGVWYHLDSQLEDNVSLRRGMVRYRYFLRSDAALSASHVWGQRLIDSGLLTAEQNAEIAANFLAPACPQDYATPAPHPLEDIVPDLAALRGEAEVELAAYETQQGALSPLTLNTIPPVFGLEGYGPADEG